MNIHTNNRGLPINSHPGAFGNARKYNFHEGIDLYGNEGDWVLAMEDGVVFSNERFTGPSVGHDWWLETDAVTIKSERGYFVYGELKSDLKVGEVVKTGQKIGELVPVLPKEKIRKDIPQHSNVMLHLEKWNFNYDEKAGWRAWTSREDRPPWLEDPTNDLITALTKKFLPVKLLTL
ncbi:MAG: M23 family metallopeptidase [Oligoflexia bacterium]|nr:M23 family metallopeptidase [Oligoflexia bacterium]